jgi:AraC-like DNA-binding protein
VLTQSIEEKEAAETQLDQNLATLRNNLLISLMEGHKMPVPLDELEALYSINFPHPYYSVIAVYIHSVIPKSEISVTKLMEDILNRNNVSYCMELGGYILCVVNTPFLWQEFRQVIEDDLENARSIIAHDLDMECYIAVGGLYNSLLEIHRAYNEAQSSIDYIRVNKNKEMVFFEDINSSNDGIVIYPFKKERILLNHLRLSDFDAAREVLDDIFRSDLLKPSLSYSMAQFVVMAMLAQLLRNICADEEDANRMLDHNNHHIEQLSRCKSIIEMKAVVFRILKESVNPENSGAGKKRQFSVMIQEYILTHYADPLLSIDSIAEALGRSAYYISKRFKIETGNTIPDFINKIRIENAKNLLLDAELTEAQIAEWVGFTSIRTYQRTFKQMEGVTHSQFKQL